MKRLTPYLLILPGGLWLAIFLVVPMVFMASVSTQEGDTVNGFVQTFNFSIFGDVLTQYQTQFLRSVGYGLAGTAIAIALAYPVAYWIAFKGGRRKSTYLLLVLLPFFVSFVLRTVSWKFLLADDGMVLGPLKSAGLLPADFHVLQTTVAVIGGLVYNYLPFMILPIYVALERVDPRVIEAAQDLYASRRGAFTKVVLPLSLPGVFAGVLMTFVPMTSDYVNASLLGGPANTMIGNIIQTAYLQNNDYPTAAALSFMLMAAMLIGIFAYARALGTENVLEAAAR
ncbi:spermidine/putrescine transport system permease protein [Streptosporangium becharense]|uniref:Spermidine/putrescine transport system permease protein n=1 Tax=Streptosporangium becharense TaxID=1816182 RepID=A0A7W9IF39_9ACTN|nr:ABC transporter permease [Streptosporangium becharense]MBB2910082.1 spermidine/putrescine transport system permease protein [Streptosporangium becharense]MBB5818963.1 spermidine/putrescine transport system permease protein [Streptosporangium becharense]